MITVETQNVPASGRVKLRTAAPLAGASKSAAGFDELARELERTTLAAGFAALRDEAMREATATAARALAAAAERLGSAVDHAEEALAADAVELGVEIARQILKLEIDAGNYDLERIVRATLGASDVKRGRVAVFLNPADAEMIRSVDFRDETEIRTDPDVARGTVHVETPRGLLVRDPAAALEEIREQLLEDLI